MNRLIIYFTQIAGLVALAACSGPDSGDERSFYIFDQRIQANQARVSLA